MAKLGPFSKCLFDVHIHIQGWRNTICGQDFTRYQLVSFCHEHCFYIHFIYVWLCLYEHVCEDLHMSVKTRVRIDGIRSFIAEVTGICGTLYSSCGLWNLNSVPHDSVEITLNP